MKGRNPTSASNIIAAAEKANFERAKAGARQVPLTLGQVLEELENRARSIHWWLEKFSAGSGKRPDHDIAEKRRQFAVLVQVRDRWAKPEDKPEGKSDAA